MTTTFKAIAGVVAVVVTLLAAPQAHDNIRRTQLAAQQQVESQHVELKVADVALQTEKVAAVAPVPQPEPPKPAPWAVTASPHGRVSVEQINVVLAHLQAKGLTKQGAAYLTGNFIAENYLSPDGCDGDGGTACGLGQWRFGRREGMPAELIPQLDWAIDVEMPRDDSRGGNHNMRGLLFDPNAGRADLLQGFKGWERYGVEGNRGIYGDAIYAQL
jgi:hypothetical protein